MTRLLLLATVMAAVGSDECFLELPNPMGPPSGGSIDIQLLGQWRCQVPPEERPNEEPLLIDMRVIPFDAHQYLAELQTKTGPMRLRAFSTRVRGLDLLNIQGLEDTYSPDRGTYVIARYVLEGAKHLHVFFVKQSPPGIGDSPHAIVQSVLAEPSKAGLYHEWLNCELTKPWDQFSALPTKYGPAGSGAQYPFAEGVAGQRAVVACRTCPQGGCILGKVVSESGAAVEGASVRVEAQALPARVLTGSSDKTGEFFIVGVPDGSYAVSAESVGHASMSFKPAFPVKKGSTYAFRSAFALRVSSIKELITVSGQLPVECPR